MTEGAPRERRITAERAELLAEMLRAVAHPLRLRIVAQLCDGDLHVGALVDRLSAPQAIVSQQLRVLRMGGLVEVTREGGRGVYRLREPRLRDLVSCMEGCSLDARGGATAPGPEGRPAAGRGRVAHAQTTPPAARGGTRRSGGKAGPHDRRKAGR